MYHMNSNPDKKVIPNAKAYILRFGERYGRYLFNMSISFDGREDQIKQWIAEGFSPSEIYMLTRDKE